MHSRKHQIRNPVEPSSPATPAARPDPELVPATKRRTFSNAEKLRILAAADACQAPGAIGALLRREGIYSSHLLTWRKLSSSASAWSYYRDNIEEEFSGRRGRAAVEPSKNALDREALMKAFGGDPDGA